MSVNARVAAYNPLLAVDNPILVAIERNDVRSILQLLAAVPRLASAINDEDPNGQQHSPLHLAAYLGRVEIATLLLDQGANVDPLEVGGDTPLMMAVAKHHVAMVRLLLARGARACHKNQAGENVFQAALVIRNREDRYIDGYHDLDKQIHKLCSPCPHCVRAEARARGRA